MIERQALLLKMGEAFASMFTDPWDVLSHQECEALGLDHEATDGAAVMIASMMEGPLDLALEAIKDERAIWVRFQGLDEAMDELKSAVGAQITRTLPAYRNKALDEAKAAIGKCHNDMGFHPEHGPMGCALDAKDAGGCICAGIAAAIDALKTSEKEPGDAE